MDWAQVALAFGAGAIATLAVEFILVTAPTPDSLIDAAFVFFDASTGQWGAFGFDMAGLALPGVTGLGHADEVAHILNGADDISGTFHLINEADNLTGAFAIINRTDDLTDEVRLLDKASDLVDGTPRNLLTDLILPRGFDNMKQYRKAMEQLDDIIKRYGIDDATYRFRGSSTTGLSMNPNKPGKWFSPSSSDIDLSIESTKLSDMIYSAGQIPSDNVPGLFLPRKMRVALPDQLTEELRQWDKYWTKNLGVKSIEPAVSDPNLVVPSITDIVFRRGF